MLVLLVLAWCLLPSSFLTPQWTDDCGRTWPDRIYVSTSCTRAHTHNHTQSHTITRNHTQSHTITHNHTQSHTISHTHTRFWHWCVSPGHVAGYTRSILLFEQPALGVSAKDELRIEGRRGLFSHRRFRGITAVASAIEIVSCMRNRPPSRRSST